MRPTPRAPRYGGRVRSLALFVDGATGAGACTILYDVDNLAPATDARAVDAPAVDADPSQVAVASIIPDTVDEGVGDDGGRPALLVLKGHNLVGTAVVTATLDGGGAVQPVVVASDASPDGAELAVAIRIPVLTDLPAGQTRGLRLTVTQGGAMATIDATVTGLDELTLTGAVAAPAGPRRYARIDVTGATHFHGTTAVQLVATAGVHLGAAVDVDAVGRTAGPGGCDGGAAEAEGGCTPGGGHHGTNAGTLGLANGGAGGGGGFGAQGTAGSGMGNGGSGDAVGNEWLVPLVGGIGTVEQNRGNGGGGGGAGLLAAATGGVGGGGGGTLALTVGGDLIVDGGGAIAATGGPGAAGGTNAAGGGGAGSGGALLVRVGGQLTAAGVWLSAAPGTVATAPANDGGAGGVGRIRIDSPDGAVAAMATTPAPIRGPAWARTIPVVTTAAPPMRLTGQPGRSFALRVNGAAAGTEVIGADGSATPSLPLVRGTNQVCAVARAESLVDESLACIDLYLTAP